MEDQNSPKELIENKLLIDLVFKKPKKNLLKTKYWIQNKPYKFGLKIQNIDEKSSSEATIKNLSLLSAEGGSITQENFEEFTVPTLNPGQEIDLWWPDPMTSIIKGSTWVRCDVMPKEENVRIKTYQRDNYTKKPISCRTPNNWGNALLIRGEMEEEQAKTNFFLLILTILMFLDGVWGLDKIVKFIINGIGWLFFFIGSLLSKLG